MLGSKKRKTNISRVCSELDVNRLRLKLGWNDDLKYVASSGWMRIAEAQR